MTTLVVDEFISSLYQEFTVKIPRIVRAIQPYLYIHGSPAGTLTLNFKHSGTTIESKAITISQLITNADESPNGYIHGYFTFQLDNDVPIKRDTTYRIELDTSGYTFTETDYIAWHRPFENTFNNTTPSLTNAEANPFGYLVWAVVDTRI